jgi:AraC-like DNA-binding protein
MNQGECIKESINYIELSLREDISLEKLAQKAFLSKYYYHRLFRNIVGEPVMEYVRKRRLSEAAKEVANTDEKLIDIAMKYQFSSQEAFIRAFKNMFGISPGQYRRDKKVIYMHNCVKVRTMNTIKSGSTKMCMAA